MTTETDRRPRTEPPLAASRRIGWCVLVMLVVPGGYILLAALVLVWIGNPVVATIAVGAIVTLTVGCARYLRPRFFAFDSGPGPLDGTQRSPGFWRWVLLAMPVTFLAGQTIALMLYGLVGSPGFDRHREAEQASAQVLVITLTLVVAPLSEEALLRGLTYPLLRKQVGVVTSAVLTSLIFACMHGNLVQAVATAPLGLVLALIAERTRGLWQVVVLHSAYNLAAALVPPGAVQALATPVGVTVMGAAWVGCLACLFVRVRSRGSAARPG